MRSLTLRFKDLFYINGYSSLLEKKLLKATQYTNEYPVGKERYAMENWNKRESTNKIFKKLTSAALQSVKTQELEDI